MLPAMLRHIRKPLSWIPSGPQHAAYSAALALVAIQVGIGIILKAAQTGGSYAFSPSASVAISEFFKMVLSTIFFYRECRRRAADAIRPSTRGGGSGYTTLPASDLPTTERRSSLEEKEREEGMPESGNANGGASSDANGGIGEKRMSGPLPHLDARTFWSYVRGEVTVDVRYGFANLALFYVLINNSIFVSYKLADPGTIQLTKSGVTFITALVMIATLKAKISKIQWIAIVIQICGLMVTQYNPKTGSTYPFSTYLILLFQVFLSASSGVYNQALLKTDDSSLHADNMILYAAGSAINLLVHIVIRILKADEPGFFTGYNSFGAIMVIVSNVFIGLAITAVYKYADAVIKCFATAVATGILLYVSPILFGTQLSFLVLPGTIVVFIASWLYMDNPPPKEPPPPAGAHMEPQKPSIFARLQAYQKRNNNKVLGAATLFTVVVVAFLTMFEAKMPSFAQNGSSAGSAYNQEMDMKIESPFKNTMAMIRWNSAHPERIPTLMKYEPFFHTVHISMPGLLPDKDPEFHNLTHDQWPGTFTVYMQLAHTMQLILDKHPDIDGIMYYHFDAWIDPLAWAGANKHNIWFPSIVDIAPPNHGGPQFICTNDVNKYNWWGWGADFHKHAMAAAAVVDHFNLEYTVKKDEWCVGWSDIYYIPRRFFADYIFLSEIFGGFSVFHEVAIPTMVHIIDQSRRRNPATPIIDRFGDCWGSCCASNPKIEDVLWARCGHRLDYLNQPVVDAFYSRLEAEGKMLGMPLPKTRYALGAGSSLARFDSATLKALNGGQDLTHTLKDDGLHDDERADREAKAQAEKDAYLKAEQEQREKEAKAKQAEKAKELADKEGAAKANASAASGSPDHSGTPPHKAAGNETVTPKGADMKTPPPPAARLLRRSVPVAALAGLGW